MVLVLLSFALVVATQLWPCWRSVAKGSRAASVESLDREFYFGARGTEDMKSVVQPQDRRQSRKHAVEELTQKSTVLDKDVRSWICQRPRCASWVTTLTSAEEPCAVLCRFLI